MMILQELNLVSFGKFEKEIIRLQKGLNIIYGDNESGKTTIHNFIDGMFYGFLKPYAKRRNYLDEHDKYRPWNRDKYLGTLKFIKDEKIYRIQRDFNNGEVWVYDDLTGRDVTADIDNGEKIKVHLPGIYFFDFNNLVYKNTISIKQLGNQVDSNLATEVKDRLANISTSLDDDISVKNAIEDLDKQLDQIGTIRAYTKPYGRAVKDLEKLKADKKDLILKQEEYHSYMSQSITLDKKIEEERENLKELKRLLEKTQLLEKKTNYEDGLKIKEELVKIDKKIEELKPYSNLSFDDYTKALKLESNIEHVSREIQELGILLDDIDNELKALELEEQEGIVDGITAEKLYDDVEIFDEMEEEKNNIIMNSNQNRLDILNSQLKGKIDKDNRFNKIIILLVVLAIGALGMTFINIVLAFLAIPLFGVALYARTIRKKIREEIDQLEGEIERICIQEKDQNQRLKDIENHQRDILSIYSCSSKSQLKRLREDIYFKQMNHTNRVDKVNRLNKNRKDAVVKLRAKNRDKKIWIDDKDLILSRNKSQTIEEFSHGLEKKDYHETLIKDKKNKIDILEKTLGNFSLEELKETVGGYEREYFKDVEGIDVEELSNKILEVEDSLTHLSNTKARLEERIDNLNQHVKRLMVVEEEIARLNNLIKDYEDRIKSIEIAKDTIDSISKEIHDQFAPAINKKVSKIMGFITDGKYDQVKINDDLNITVENPATKEIIDIGSLSGGTIDQLYFALRFSITSSMETEDLPLILDDCFIQYDDTRLINILKYLSDISNRKQILLFTCQNREREILDELGLKYNLIQLT